MDVPDREDADEEGRGDGERVERGELDRAQRRVQYVRRKVEAAEDRVGHLGEGKGEGEAEVSVRASTPN